MKKGQTDGSSAAVFILIVTILIIFFVLLVPGDIFDGTTGGGRQPSTGGGVTPGSGGWQIGADFIFTGPGRMSPQSRTEYTHSLATFSLRGFHESTQLAFEPGFRVSRTIFSSNHKIIRFTADPQNTENALLAFVVSNPQGVLEISLNGEIIFSQLVSGSSLPPISLRNLKENNELIFSLQSPGFAFWNTPELSVSNMRVLADVIDRSGLIAQQQFELRSVETQRMFSSRLRFFPDCNDNNGILTIHINNNTLLQKRPDCGVLNVVSIPVRHFVEGVNTITFESEFGSYLVDRAEILTQLERDGGVTYFFNLDSALFTQRVTTQPVCGESDGICPVGCSAHLDKDCCFAQNVNGYWCAVPTAQSSDRCVARVDEFNVDRCPSGYEDRNGRVPDQFRGMCGDNNDGVCPAGCSAQYDLDCCLTFGSGNFFCKDLPIGGVSNICRSSLTIDECTLCPSGYIGESRNPQCTPQTRNVIEHEFVLLHTNQILAEFFFVDDAFRKEAEVIINGYKTFINTGQNTAVIDISQFVQRGNNYIQIVPLSEFSLVKVEVDIRRR